MIAVLFTVLALQGQSPSPQGAPRTIVQPAPSAEAIAADTGTLRHASGRTPPIARAARTTQAPAIDGRLDDAAWSLAAPITALFQREPAEGAEASERTEVRILYDDDAIYVGARMYDREPHLIRSELGRRDNTGPSDELFITFDSYHDHRTAFQFSVNPSGVRADAALGADEAFGDQSWDPVWEAQTRRDSLGWTAEMRIPLSQLRFPPAAEQVWGVNVRRWIHRKAESAEFGWKSNTESGHASHFGHLFGLASLPQPRRLEMLPYATANQRFDQPETGNPFRDGSRTAYDVGADFKYGITSNLTLDATINPDFGQVEQDPAVVNISAFETFLQERRPFFIEGADIFRFQGNQFFHSRRIGQPPRGLADDHAGFVDAPENSTILGAAKLSGRTSGGWSIGLLEAITQREFATIDSSGTRFSEEVEPLTNYAVGRIKRDLRGGATQFGIMATSVNRDLRHDDLRFLRSSAYAGGLDFTHRFARNQYSINGSFAASHIRGDTLALQIAQQSSARYYQRPDADYVDYDPARTTLSGWSGRLNVGRQQGSFTWRLAGNATSPGFEINDAGFQTRGDNRNVSLNVERRWTRPGTFARSASWGGDLQRSWNFGGIHTGSFIGSYYNIQFRNYWSINGSVASNTRAFNDVLTRGGPLGYQPPTFSTFLGINSDYRKRVNFFLGTFFFTNELGSRTREMFGTLSIRASSNFNVDVSPSVSYSRTAQQYVTTLADATAAATYGARYVFAEIEQHFFDLTTRLNVTFSPSLSLQLYTQPFIATGDYRGHKELIAPGRPDFITYGATPGSTLDSVMDANGTVIEYSGDPDGGGGRPAMVFPNLDFNFRSLRGNAVLRWEYRPGSTLFFVWTQNCGRFDPDPSFRPGTDIRSLCQGRSQNVFAVKANWWLSL